jgi:hypothetical protein
MGWCRDLQLTAQGAGEEAEEGEEREEWAEGEEGEEREEGEEVRGDAQDVGEEQMGVRDGEDREEV